MTSSRPTIWLRQPRINRIGCVLMSPRRFGGSFVRPQPTVTVGKAARGKPADCTLFPITCLWHNKLQDSVFTK
jgi:hypothetical protein